MITALSREISARVSLRLDLLRVQRGLTLEELAIAAGSHRPIVGRVLLGKHVPSLEVVWSIARALGVHPVRDVLVVLDDLPPEVFT